MPIGCVPGYVPTYMSSGSGSVNKGYFSNYRSAPFDVNTFVQHIVENMKIKFQEYEKARFKSFTRFEEKCAFIDNAVFPAVKAYSEKPTPGNAQAMVSAFKEGVSRFTTFGKMSGLARIFDSAYFAMTSRFASPPVVDMDNYTRSVVYGPVENKAENTTPVVGVPVQNKETSRCQTGFFHDSIVVGVPVNHRQQQRIKVDHTFFSMMRSVQVPKHEVEASQSNTMKRTEVVHQKQYCSA